MLSFRYHVVSLVAVFLSLGIGVVVGSTLVDRGEARLFRNQLADLDASLTEARGEIGELRRSLEELRAERETLAEQGRARLVADRLDGVGVVVVTAGGRGEVLDEAFELLATAGAELQGTVGFTDRWALDDDGDVADLRRAAGLADATPPSAARLAALERFATAVRRELAEDPAEVPDEAESDPGAGAGGGRADLVTAATLLSNLREEGFVEVDGPAGEGGALALDPGTRVLVVSAPEAAAPPETLAVPLVRALADPGEDGADLPRVPLVVAEPGSTEPEAADPSGVASAVRGDELLRARVSTVDNLAEFAGQLAVVYALVDVGGGKVGHYGVGPDADRLVPAPPG